MTVGKRIRRRRQQIEWSQGKLGKECGLSRPYISQIELSDDVSDYKVGHLRAIGAALWTDLKSDAALRQVLFGDVIGDQDQ